jgi:hypothetical protein
MRIVQQCTPEGQKVSGVFGALSPIGENGLPTREAALTSDDNVQFWQCITTQRRPLIVLAVLSKGRKTAPSKAPGKRVQKNKVPVKRRAVVEEPEEQEEHQRKIIILEDDDVVVVKDEKEDRKVRKEVEAEVKTEVKKEDGEKKPMFITIDEDEEF